MVSVAQNRILVVEDERDMRNGLRKILSRGGYGVEIAEDGLKALEKMKEGAFQVIIADLKMPGMDGVGVLRHAKEINQSVAVIIITGYGTVASAVESMRLGAADYIAKPFSQDEILRAVEKALVPLKASGKISDKKAGGVPSVGLRQASGAGRTRQPIAERRVLLEHCEGRTTRAAQTRIATPENLGLLAETHSEKAQTLWQWLPLASPQADLDTYVGSGGYQALGKALAGRPEAVISEVKESGLIGRGGAGFLTGLKWEAAFRAADAEKYFVCNAEEGEPGALKDKTLLDQNPHKVIEGTIIGAYAIGAAEGYVYIKDAYSDSADLVERAIQQAASRGFLGQHILGSAFSFTLRVMRVPGAYVCGEETALCRSIEGKRPSPQTKPPYPTACGIFQRPTVINNVETLANIPHIIGNGAKWFKGLGVPGSFGTKLFSISGNVRNAGVFEVELGKYTLKELIYGLAQGVEDDRGLKAVLPGGPSTAFVSADALDVPVDYKSMERAGTSLGTGAVVVLDERVSIPELLRHFFSFYQKESCGDCTPCRLGTKRVAEILRLLTEPMGPRAFHEWQQLGGAEGTSCLDMLSRFGTAMRYTAKCGLGQAAAEPLMSSIRLFASEYLALIAERQKEYRRLLERSCSPTGSTERSDPVRSIIRRIGLQ